MPSWLLVAGDSSELVISYGWTEYSLPCGWLESSTAESDRQFVARDSYTLRNLFVRVTANTLDNSTTVRSRKNTANGNQSVSIAAAATGTFQDTINSDSLADGDLFNSQLVVGGTTGSIYFTVLSFCLETVSNNTPILCGANIVSYYGATKYVPIGGNQTGNDTESTAQYTFRVSATLSNLRALVSENGTTGASTVRTRVNGGNGAQSVSIPAGTAGAFEDATNTDSISPGDDVNFQLVAGAGSGFENITVGSYQLKSTSLGRQTVAAYTYLPTQSFNTTRYAVIEDALPAGVTTESDAQVITEIGFDARNYFVRVTANTLDDSTTVALRVNGANSALLVSIAATATGTFEDSDSVSIAVDDLLNNMVATGGTSGDITITIIGFELVPPVAPPVPPAYPLISKPLVAPIMVGKPKIR